MVIKGNASHSWANPASNFMGHFPPGHSYVLEVAAALVRTIGAVQISWSGEVTAQCREGCSIHRAATPAPPTGETSSPSLGRVLFSETWFPLPSPTPRDYRWGLYAELCLSAKASPLLRLQPTAPAVASLLLFYIRLVTQEYELRHIWSGCNRILNT